MKAQVHSANSNLQSKAAGTLEVGCFGTCVQEYQCGLYKNDSHWSSMLVLLLIEIPHVAVLDQGPRSQSHKNGSV